MKKVLIRAIQIPGENSQPQKWQELLKTLKKEAEHGPGIVVLPELFLHTYFCIEEHPAYFDLAHPVDSDNMEQLRLIAKETQLTLVVPFFEKCAPGIFYNSLVIYDSDGQVAGHYRKMHIPDDPGFYEKYYFSPGDKGFLSFSTKHANIGTLICWDQWFPEAARLTSMQGAEILVYPTAIGWDDKELAELDDQEQSQLKSRQLNAWQTIQRSHAIANGVFVLAVNRIGKEGHLNFWGHSFLCSPEGEVLKELNEQSGILRYEIDLSTIDTTRRVWPFLRDRRIDSYKSLQKRFLK